MNLILSFFNFIISFNFIQMNHPLAMGILLLIQTIIISMMCGLFTYSYWYSYILFLIMIGGMLILFMYMTSLASNELFKFSLMNIMIIFMSIFIILLIYLFMDKFMIMNQNMEMYINTSFMYMNKENEFNLIKLYNNPTMNLTILTINYLLLTLIVIVKITNPNYGPLRQNF
uniref:NADH-ubiquinone oxidoreductase chain 6 n=1 Tax=Nymphes myrmeleonoides TaxID=560922 RepID=A0A088CAR8_NYMMY|nr:NADH dehydrogenase subunit 6 [Nymphes myrmeleonoides]AHY39221.1 NADH dehydrogenase subunit 6 [Nymphes myrmeleonoides]